MEKTNPNLFYVSGEAEGAPGLKGTRCVSCGAAALLEVPVCPVCLSRNVKSTCIGARATLTRFSTVFHSADSFEAPYVIGQVHTAEGPSTFAPILAPNPRELRQGMKLKFSLIERGAPGRIGFAYVPDKEAL
jgi:uncharacterized OB-fold protein